MNLSAALFLVALTATQAPTPDPSTLIAMARSGQGAEAWRLWRTLPPSVDRTRTGVLLSAATGDIAGGISLYSELTKQTNRDDGPALAALATSAAAGLVGASSTDVRIAACGVALHAGTSSPPCEKLLAELINPTLPLNVRAVAVYRLANAGWRPWPEFFVTYQDQLDPATRLLVASEFTRLPASERIELIAPIFSQDSNRSRILTAVSLLGDIPGPEAADLLRRLEASELTVDVRLSVAVALARHGDADSVRFLQDARGNITGPRAVDIGVVLALAGSPYGPNLERVVEITTGVDRGRLAVMLGRQRPELAQSAIAEMLTDPGVDVQRAALKSAALIGLGLTPQVYEKLGHTNPEIRLAAVLAVLQTTGS